MATTCKRCANLDLKGSDLGRLSLGLCKARKNPQSKASMVSVDHQRECAKFNEAPPETIERREFLLRQEEVRQ
jgi:hypothetical protein